MLLRMVCATKSCVNTFYNLSGNDIFMQKFYLIPEMNDFWSKLLMYFVEYQNCLPIRLQLTKDYKYFGCFSFGDSFL